MKWTEEQKTELRTLCLGGMSNADLAARYGCPVSDIHAIRSREGITIPKCRVMQDKPTSAAPVEMVPAALEHGLSQPVAEGFLRLRAAVSAEAARDRAAFETVCTYRILLEMLTAVEKSYDGLLRGREL